MGQQPPPSQSLLQTARPRRHRTWWSVVAPGPPGRPVRWRCQPLWKGSHSCLHARCWSHPCRHHRWAPWGAHRRRVGPGSRRSWCACLRAPATPGRRCPHRHQATAGALAWTKGPPWSLRTTGTAPEHLNNAVGRLGEDASRMEHPKHPWRPCASWHPGLACPAMRRGWGLGGRGRGSRWLSHADHDAISAVAVVVWQGASNGGVAGVCRPRRGATRLTTSRRSTGQSSDPKVNAFAARMALSPAHVR